MTTLHPDPRYGGYVPMSRPPDIVLGWRRLYWKMGSSDPLTDERRSNILDENASLADNALRVLGWPFSPL